MAHLGVASLAVRCRLPTRSAEASRLRRRRIRSAPRMALGGRSRADKPRSVPQELTAAVPMDPGALITTQRPSAQRACRHQPGRCHHPRRCPFHRLDPGDARRERAGRLSDWGGAVRAGLHDRQGRQALVAQRAARRRLHRRAAAAGASVDAGLFRRGCCSRPARPGGLRLAASAGARPPGSRCRCGSDARWCRLRAPCRPRRAPRSG